MSRTARWRALVLAAVLTGVAGCAGGEPATSRGSASGTAAGAGSATATVPVEAPLPGFGSPVAVGSDLAVPWGLAFLPDGDALVAERPTGRILRVTRTGGQRVVMTVPGVADLGEGGLLGLALSPHYASDGLLYAYYTTEQDNRIARFTLGGEPQILLQGIDNAQNHDGGRIAFGPDGMLYAGVGDAGEPDHAQDPESLNGKILRLTPDGRVPPDNPDPDSYVYTMGHRNVQGLAWDGSGAMYGVEFGQSRFDEVNLIQPGRNYGWPVVEGRGDTDGGRFTNPLVTWTTDEASPSGAAVIGQTLYVAALQGERLWAVPITGPGRLGDPVPRLVGAYGRLRTVAEGPDGALWLTTSNTSRGEPRAGDDHVYRFPVA